MIVVVTVTVNMTATVNDSYMSFMLTFYYRL